jgi:uncharacterized protein YutE (UPF0331/DUF86 family)
MTTLNLETLAEKTAAVERHLARVQEKLPATAAALQPSSDASDAVVLHLWQAVQIVIDLALATCIHLHLGTPSGYADAFQKLSAAGHLEKPLAHRLVQATGLRNRIAHAYEKLDMERVFAAAKSGPEDLRAYLAVLRGIVAR